MTVKAVPIGEVLSQLKEEFPDVSVSKIRFLESEGLISPQRTPSGYRKFGPSDVERLRTVLRLQRDSFLPLRVIRDKLDAGEDPADIVASRAVPPAEGAPPPARAPEPPKKEDLLAPPPKAALTLSDLAATAGLELSEAEALREFGVICPHGSDGLVTYDGSDLAIARLAKEFISHGIDARHLKTLRRIAEQEAQIYGAWVTPSMRNPRPEVREQAVVELGEIARLARELRQTYVAQTLRGVLDGDG